MAKGARSNHKKAVRTQRRLTLKASWQEEADARRYAALAEAASAAPMPITSPVAMQDDDQEERGRAKPKKKVAATGDDAMQTESASTGVGKGKKKKGFKVNGVQKKTHNGKKSSALWVSSIASAVRQFKLVYHIQSMVPHFVVLYPVKIILIYHTVNSECILFQVTNFHKNKRGKQGFQ